MLIEALLIVLVLLGAFAVLGLAMFIMYKLGLYVVYSFYGDRLGLTQADEEHPVTEGEAAP